MAWRTSRIRAWFLRLRQRLNRWIWLRRSRCLTRLSESVLKNLWLQQSLFNSPSQNLSLQEMLDLDKRQKLSALECSLPLTPEAVETMEDLQLASMQLTSMLENKPCSETSSSDQLPS